MRGAKRLNLGPANGRSAESVLRAAKLPRQPRRQSATGGDANDRSVKSFLAPLRLNLMTRCCGRRAPAEQSRGIMIPLTLRHCPNLIHCSPSSFIALSRKIGRASCRERVCPYVYVSGVGVSLKKKKHKYKK